jgi:hypothetical protein
MYVLYTPAAPEEKKTYQIKKKAQIFHHKNGTLTDRSPATCGVPNPINAFVVNAYQRKDLVG